MTDRILSSSGKYAPVVHDGVPVVDGVNPDDLPQVKPDPYADVDHRDFSNASSMSRVQQLTMAQIAQSRGDSSAAMEWKFAAQSSQLDEDRASDAARMKKMLEPKEYTPHVGPLVEPKAIEPWAQDPAYVAAQAKVDTAQANAEKIRDGSPERVEANNAIQKAQLLLGDVVDELKDKMQWTETEQRTLEAQASLRDKSDAVAQMMGIPS